MKVAAPYPLNKERQQKIDEYNILYTIDTKIEDLCNGLDQHQDKRINLELVDELVSDSTISPIVEKYDNVYFRLNHLRDLDMVKSIPNTKYFLDYIVPINSFTSLHSILKQGVTDVYLWDDLCYDLETVFRICQKQDVNIRFVANVVPSTSLKKKKEISSPWFVPENYDFLDKYIDVIEFELIDDGSRFDTLYKLGVKNHNSNLLDLRDINLEINIPNVTIDSGVQGLAEYKGNCGIRCKRASNCRKCHQLLKIANEIRENLDKINIKKDIK